MSPPAPTPPAARPAVVEAALLAILVLSLHGFVAIPFMGPLGLDLHNLYAFHQCAARDDPYLATGAACGDALGRHMLYPPPLYWAFAWLRPLSAEGALLVWAAVVALGTALSLLPFAPASRWRGDGRLGLVAGLLLAQYPLLFALERGNNDVLVLLCWAGALLAWRARRPALAGGAIGLSAALKLYPAVGALPVAAAVVADAVGRPEGRRAALRFAAGGLAGALVPLALLAGQVRTWATVQLPALAAGAPGASVFSHALGGVVDDAWARPMQLVLVAAWAAAAVRRWRGDPALVLAGALATSTSVARTSFDYNLITALPLLLVQWQRAAAGRWRPGWDLALAAGLVAVAGSRFAWSLAPALADARVLLLWGWLLASALVALGRAGAEGADAADGRAPGTGTDGEATAGAG